MGVDTRLPQKRPRISLRSDGVLLHGADVVRVVMRRGIISIGCTDITPEAAARVVAVWNEIFGGCDGFDERVVLQGRDGV